jgi:hypothetical protein
MSYTTSQIRAVRLLIPDTEAIYGEGGNEYIFEEGDIAIFLEQGFDNAKCAAGLAKMSIGSSEALILKAVKNYETTTNGPALLREWVAAGEKLYDRGLAEIADDDADAGIFEIVYPDYGYLRHPEGDTHRSELSGGWL